MSLKRFLPGSHRSDQAANPFGSLTPAVSEQPLELTAAPTGAQPARRPKRSWFGWLFGNSRRAEPTRLIQGELLLQRVKPVRNDFRDEAPAGARPKPTVLWETPAKDTPSDDQHHAWNRLRNRRPAAMVVNAE